MGCNIIIEVFCVFSFNAGSLKICSDLYKFPKQCQLEISNCYVVDFRKNSLDY